MENFWNETTVTKLLEHLYGGCNPKHLADFKEFYTASKKEDNIESLPKCCICGGETVLIRGKYPNTQQRNVCPQCTTERLEQISEISSKDYGKTYQNG